MRVGAKDVQTLPFATQPQQTVKLLRKTDKPLIIKKKKIYSLSLQGTDFIDEFHYHALTCMELGKQG